RFDMVEGLSGWKHDDILRGDDRGLSDLGTPELPDPDEDDPGNEPPVLEQPELNGEQSMIGHELTEEGADRIAGIREILSSVSALPGDLALNVPTPFDFAEGVVWTGGNLLLGGAGSDFF